MTRLAEDYDYVTGGDPDRDSIDLAVLDTATGGIRAHIEAPADRPGYARMLGWARQHAPGRRVRALEGTGSFAAGQWNAALCLSNGDDDERRNPWLSALSRNRDAHSTPRSWTHGSRLRVKAD
jgi:hypothetical protein